MAVYRHNQIPIVKTKGEKKNQLQHTAFDIELHTIKFFHQL